MVDRRSKNAQWHVVDAFGRAYSGSYNHAILAVLMDLRDELQAMRQRLDCWETREIPRHLREIAKNTRRKKKAPIVRPKLRRVA